MSKLRTMTIRHKLISIIMLTCITSLLLAGAAFIAWEWANLRLHMVQDLSTHTKMVAENCKAALVFEDTKDAEKTLRALHVEPSIVYACIRNSSGEHFTDYYRYDVDKSIQPCKPHQQEGYVFGDDYLIVFKHIVLDGEVIGTVCLRSDLQPMYTMLKRNTAIIIAILLLVSMVAYFVSSRLQKVISGPILGLAESATRIGKGELSHRVKIRSKDELGHLAAAFNDMAGKLKESYAGLEEKVKERTAELSSANEKLEVEIAERKQAEEALEISNRELKDFVYIASHDLREPLRKISSFGELLKDSLEGKLNRDEKENLEFMVNGANRMTEMIEGLLTYSRVNTKGISFQAVNLNEVVEQLEQLDLAVLLEETGGTIEVPQPLPVVEADPIQMRQLLQNLIANGIRYRRDEVRPRIVIRAKHTDGDKVRIEVQDNGIGIEEVYYEDIFTMFRRLHPRQRYGGTGIGLAVCRKIIDRHGGRIGLESKYGEGTTLWFTLSAASEAVAVS